MSRIQRERGLKKYRWKNLTHQQKKRVLAIFSEGPTGNEVWFGPESEKNPISRQIADLAPLEPAIGRKGELILLPVWSGPINKRPNQRQYAEERYKGGLRFADLELHVYGLEEAKRRRS